jgi:multidrug efflux pump subunit AcrA (membrane-fusion protein)
MTARVEILTAERAHVLSVPIDAVLQFDGKDRVAVKDGTGGFVLREVTLGIANDTSIEVKQGLREGELVVQNAAALRGDDAKRAKIDPLPPPAAKRGVPRQR